METVENAPLIGRDRSCDLAVHDGEASKRAQPSAHELPRNVDIGMADAVHVRAEGDPIRIEARRGPRFARSLDPPLDTARVRAEREHDAICGSGGRGDDPRTRRGALHRNLR